MPKTQTAPYGSWSSPITSDLIVASSIGLSEIMLDGKDVYWIDPGPRKADGRSSFAGPPTAAGPTSLHPRGPAARTPSMCAHAFMNTAAAPIW